MKRILSIVLAIMMVVAFTFAMPLTASAASKPGKIGKLNVVSEMAGDGASNIIGLDWSKSKNAKKYEVYKASSKNGKYKKAATLKYRYWSKTLYGLNYFKVRGINGSKKGAFTSKCAAYGFRAKITDITQDIGADTTTIKIQINNSKSSKAMNFHTEGSGHVITYKSGHYWSMDDEDKLVIDCSENFSYKYVDEQGNSIEGDTVVVPKKTKGYLYLIADSSKVYDYYKAATTMPDEDWDEDEYDGDEDWDEDDYDDNVMTDDVAITFMIKGMAFDVKSGNATVPFTVSEISEIDTYDYFNDSWFVAE